MHTSTDEPVRPTLRCLTCWGMGFTRTPLDHPDAGVFHACYTCGGLGRIDNPRKVPPLPTHYDIY